MMHAGACLKLDTQAFLLTAEQADDITTALARVAQHYDIAVLDPKVQAWIMLAGIVGKTYVPMGFAFYAERQQRGAAMNGAKDLAQTPMNGVHEIPIVNVNPMGSGAVN